MTKVRLWAARRPWLAFFAVFLFLSVFVAGWWMDGATFLVLAAAVVIPINRLMLRNQAKVPPGMERHSMGQGVDLYLPRDTGRGPAAPVRAAAPMPIRRAQRGAAGGTPDLAELAASMRPVPVEYAESEQLEVAGENYRINEVRGVFDELGRDITARGSTIDDLACLLIPQPWNEYDGNAVAVMIGQWHVGYLEAPDAARHAPGLNWAAQRGAAMQGQARIWAKAEGGMIRARVTVTAPAPAIVQRLVQTHEMRQVTGSQEDRA